MNLKKYSRNLYCFSPPVMLFTFLFEFGAAFYLLWRYKMSPLIRIVAAVLLTLGIFQLAEYLICGGLGFSGGNWAKLGYISITLLPALGIHAVMILAGKNKHWIIGASYVAMGAFVAYFALAPGVVNIQECRPNYAVFNLESTSMYVYMVYYYGLLSTGAYLSWYYARKSINSAALMWLTGGYLAFMLPTATVNLIDPSTLVGIPSIMCGFAVTLAIVLLFFVVPKSKLAEKKEFKKQKQKSSV